MLSCELIRGGSALTVDEPGGRSEDGGPSEGLLDKLSRSFKRRIPILRWLPSYNRKDAVGDLVAGITVGLTVIPQSLAYSSIAGLPPQAILQYGLYGSFLGSIIYIVIGSCKDSPVGPTAIVSLLTFQTVGGRGPHHAILLCFLSGCIELLMGILGLGFLIDFVSGPVSSGFTSAVALVILTSQVKDILGIPASGSTFLEMWNGVFHTIEKTRLWDTILGIICILTLLLMRTLSSVRVGPEDVEKRTVTQKLVNKILWLVATSRNAILVPSPTSIGHIPAGLPDVQPPPFSISSGDNSTVGFLEMVSDFGSGLVVLPLLALLEDIAICKAFSSGKTVDATQEMIAIGICNIANSFVQGFPISGSLSRSAVSNGSGVRTPLGGLYTDALQRTSWTRGRREENGDSKAGQQDTVAGGYISQCYTGGHIPAGLPDVQPPPFSISSGDNSTVGFLEMVSDFGSGLVVLPLLALLEDIAICKAF
ncbi:hypothetical protein J437_LFUL005961 [Ladona fulva]|uniref:SLC26A/SulP transporter domain-containing protein n=1 Tax=Ladona fulva TaxID=123851 RepID=A0A8K0K073_LADFU|nr:hypothetical protein J437_LFUL005961 [Ladona fulva]